MLKGKKISILAAMRACIQVLCYILLPSLYISTLMGVKEIYTSLIHNNMSVDILPYLIEIIAIIPITVLFGRFFCGWMCAFGSFTDLIYKLGSEFLPKKRLKEEIDSKLKIIKYVLLAFIIIAIWSLDLSLFKNMSPWDAFGMIFTLGKLPDFNYVVTYLIVGFILLIAIMVASAFIERFFCRYLCPMGAIFALTSFLRVGKIRKPTKDCGKCKICTNNCAMGIPLYKYDEVNSIECINCMKCVTACPRNNTSYAIAKKDVKPLVAGCASIAMMTGTYYVGTITANASGASTTISSQVATNKTNTIYNNGTYEGSGIGFRGQTTTVSVTLENDTITNIETISYGDDKEFYDRAFSSVTNDIISLQSTDVHAVSGATYSSNGIMEAVENALNSAKIDGGSSEATDDSNSTETQDDYANSIEDSTDDSTESDDLYSDDSSNSSNSDTYPDKPDHGDFGGKGERRQQGEEGFGDNPEPNSNSSSDTIDSNNNTDSDVTESDVTESGNEDSGSTVSTVEYVDGTYEGSGTGFRGATTTVSVTVTDSKIASISVISHGDDAPFFNRAYDTVTEEIISEQSTNVDSVSGATYSSNGIMEAVSNALGSAMKN
jgi:uncharacterized protein with FMN-binding domain